MKVYTGQDLLSFGDFMAEKQFNHVDEVATNATDTDVLAWRSLRNTPPIVFESGQEIEIVLPIGVRLIAEITRVTENQAPIEKPTPPID